MVNHIQSHFDALQAMYKARRMGNQSEIANAERYANYTRIAAKAFETLNFTYSAASSVIKTVMLSTARAVTLFKVDSLRDHFNEIPSLRSINDDYQAKLQLIDDMSKKIELASVSIIPYIELNIELTAKDFNNGDQFELQKIELQKNHKRRKRERTVSTKPIPKTLTLTKSDSSDSTKKK